ncbi:Re/Si-specific NAD(P)(+) transhydrogenase subunit alpha [Desulfobulbus rhabdoformis]|uniref:Re/Si-specific NAD(P)(+) transhydrogenase subunit alpha n=1 Tax=Desulfobulbus rhabdoformis TaxID=34032 RepID=UPI001963E08E|nr:Re/Si-specific NAD(P)(+) transhydrogenase subunit alpha [Desulfobulbus rhabdoformis]MBM9614057.1 Re/Si-specific NAD(P)(+) transhydrogenase subunit alpha [Desulfobulbus rhabdoformis]
MNIAVMKEIHPGETRVPVVPATVDRLCKLGAKVVVETGMGVSCRFDDAAYEAVGASIGNDRNAMLGQADIVLRLRKPPLEEISLMRRGTMHVSYLDPFREKELVDAMVAQEISGVSLEMIPRTTLAQKMDVLSSQANLAGYVSVLLGCEHLNKILPMMTTPAGTIKPARVFIIGVGVAGLQAIATARRLGARVEAFDTRPVVEEQVKSLGAKFVKVDLGQTGQTKDGYATQLTPEQMELQKQGMAKACSQADIVITTAQLFGRPAPRIVDGPMIAQMQPGSVIVDMAVETGGNVEGSVLDQVVEIDGVKVVGMGNLPGQVALTASEMYSANLGNFVGHFWDKEEQKFQLNLEDEIIRGALVTHDGDLFSEMYKSIINK